MREILLLYNNCQQVDTKIAKKSFSLESAAAGNPRLGPKAHKFSSATQ